MVDLVLCIDVGCSHTGYAFSSAREFETRLLDIHMNEEWMSGHANLHTYKAPSIVLLQPDKTLAAFGYDAERRYVALQESRQHDAWFIFRRFKSELKIKQFRKDSVILEDGGKSMNAIALFSLVLKYLKEHFLSSLQESGRYGPMETVTRDYNIKYVLTVPTKWDNASRECMKLAAKKAGLSPTHLFSESEAAARYLGLIPIRPSETSPFYLPKPNSKQAIVNLGGCGIDTTIQEILFDGTIREISKNIGAGTGATRVDSDFLKFIGTLFPADFIEAYSKKHKLDFLELQYEFEVKKKKFTMESELGASLELPASIIKLYTTRYKQPMQYMIDDSEYVGRIISRDEYLILDKTVMKDIFGPAVKSTVGYLTNLSRDPELKQCDAIILVGGFADSPVVAGAVRFYFPNSNMITVEGADICNLIGGVILGHSQNTVIRMTSRYSYGIGMAVPFNHNAHPRQKLFMAKDLQFCSDVFRPQIFGGKTYDIGAFSTVTVLRLNRSQQKRIRIPVHVARLNNVKFTTDNTCSVLGKLTVNIGDSSNGKVTVNVQMALLGDDLIVMATQDGSTETSSASFPLVWK
ncbi:hypothetical protein DPMN_112168 [Dreissena polymorpha]|uniref:Uncharacterized protein n=1 Tax=Dreissena polymorpha TaxID=45954 RepID=A0A9D4QPR6_DREPO|nr:hypothetical protein DPMN_112168 [Dreissena polymorpha]